MNSSFVITTALSVKTPFLRLVTMTAMYIDIYSLSTAFLLVSSTAVYSRPFKYQNETESILSLVHKLENHSKS